MPLKLQKTLPKNSEYFNYKKLLKEKKRKFISLKDMYSGIIAFITTATFFVIFELMHSKNPHDILMTRIFEFLCSAILGLFLSVIIFSRFRTPKMRILEDELSLIETKIYELEEKEKDEMMEKIRNNLKNPEDSYFISILKEIEENTVLDFKEIG